MLKYFAEGLLLLSATLAAGVACTSSGQPTPEGPAEPAPDGTAQLPDDPSTSARKKLTASECEAQGGTVVGDIGDGAIHRSDYRCPNGSPPLGDIAPAAGEPIAVEGSVCCGSSPP